MKHRKSCFNKLSNDFQIKECECVLKTFTNPFFYYTTPFAPWIAICLRQKIGFRCQVPGVFSSFNNVDDLIYGETLHQNVRDGPDVIRTHDLPVISRAHHRAMLRAQKFT